MSQINGFAIDYGNTAAEGAGLTPQRIVMSIAGLRANTQVGSGQVTVAAYIVGGIVGGGLFIYNSSDTTSADNGGTIIVDAAGNRWYREFSGSEVDVGWFGALGGMPAVSDSVAIQACHDYVEQVLGGGVVANRSGQVYYNDRTLRFNPTRVSLLGGSATYDFRLKMFIAQSAMPELTTNGNFAAAGANWLNGTLGPGGSANWTFAAGSATHAPPNPNPPNEGEYGDFGQQLAGVQAGTICTVTIVIASLSQVGDQNYLDVGIRTGIGGPGGNGVGFGDGPVSTFTAAGTYTFLATAPADTPTSGAWLTISSNNNAVVSSISIKQVPNNDCLLIQTPDNAFGAQFGHDFHFCRDLQITAGPSNQPLAVAVDCNTVTPNFSTRWSFQNIYTVNVGFGLVAQNNTFLVKSHDCTWDGYVNGYSFLGGTNDGGENISFYGGNISGQTGYAVVNNGGENYFHSVSFDFPAAFIQSTGTAPIICCYGCHFETRASAMTTLRPFDNSGYLGIFGGYILGGGTTGISIPFDYFIYNETSSAITVLDGVFGFAWYSSTGQTAGGPGQVLTSNLQPLSNSEISGIINRTTIQSALGAAGLFEDGVSVLDDWVGGPSAAPTLFIKSFNPGPHNVGGGQIAGAFTVTAGSATGSYSVVMVQPQSGTGAFNVINPSGGIDGSGVIGTAYTGSINFTLNANGVSLVAGDYFICIIQQSTIQTAKTTFNFQNNGGVFASISAAISSAFAHTGTKSMAFSKTVVGPGTDAEFNILIPIRPGGGVIPALELWLKTAPVTPTAGQMQQLFTNISFVSVSGRNAVGAPIITQILQIQELNPIIDMSAVSAWSLLSYNNPIFSNESSPTNNYSPSWATHVLFNMNAIALSPVTLYLDDMYAFGI